MVAMATYSYQRLLMGKVEIESFLLSQRGYFEFFNRNVY